jgi:NRAMP (natural resistance-associated macrophage protein)-like metal ion transporter
MAHPTRMNPPNPKKPQGNIVTRIFRLMGPGVITGAADDDPSGIATYSIAGAQMGTSLLWTSVITWPLMAAVQMMCARIGMVTGEGLASGLRKKMPRWICIVFVVALLVANTINVGADLAGMADAAELLTGINSHIYVVFFGIAIASVTVKFKYHQIAHVLKWLCLSLGAYVLTAFLVHPHWGAILHDTFIPSWPADRDAWGLIVGILGTTISPYLFFWQTAQEVEEEKAKGRRMLVRRYGATSNEIVNRRIDVGLGTFFSNVVMFFVILSCAITLHQHGITQISTSKEAAEALRPLAGNLATLLYTLGLIGVGCLAIPTLAGSAAYAFAETFDWTEGLDEPYEGAREFYVVLIVSIACGIVMNFLGLSPIKTLYWTAVINGLLAPFLLVGIYLVATDRTLMGKQPSSGISRAVVIVTIVAMFGAGAGLFLT